MKFVEETGGQWAADKLRMAEADFEQQKREWEANRQAALRKAEEEAELQQQMDEDDYPLTYSSEDAKNQVKAKSNSRTVEQRASSNSSRGDVGRSARRSGARQVAAGTAASLPLPPPAQSSSRTSLGRRATTHTREQQPNSSSSKKGRLSSESSARKSPTKAVANNSSANSSSSSKRGGVVNGGDKGVLANSFVSPGGKQMPRGKGMMDTSTPIRKVLRARYTSCTVTEESADGGSVKSSRSRSRQRGQGMENGDHHNNHHHGGEERSELVINCDDDSNSECSMDVMVDSNDATDSNRTGNDNDSLHSVTSMNRSEEDGGGGSVTTPRTRSRGSVKINLWTLDDSPLPIVSRMRPSRLATDSLNASSLVGLGSESEAEGEEEDEDDRSLEEIRRSAAAEKSKTSSVNGGSPPPSRKRKDPSSQGGGGGLEGSAAVVECKRMTRRASVLVLGTTGATSTRTEHNNHMTNVPIALPVTTP